MKKLDINERFEICGYQGWIREARFPPEPRLTGPQRLLEFEDIILTMRITERVQEPDLVKPPLGLTPKRLRQEQRLQEIQEAMERYKEAQKEIPAEWYQEHVNLSIALGGLD